MQLTVGIGLLGCGTVGASVAERLIAARDAIERRSGVGYELRAIAVRDERKPRPASLPAALFTRDAGAVVDDATIDLIVECVGGTVEAADLVERALDRGRHVVTANKDLLATQGPRLQAIAASRGVTLRYEAAVGGAIPIIRSLDDALAGDEVRAIGGVFNGTCTSILSAMEDGAGYAEALARAQQLGYAEADPTSDVDGIDAAHKLALLVQLAFSLAVLSPRIRRVGISGITKRDIARAKMLGLRIRLVAAAVRAPGGALAEVAPLLVPQSHPFARARGAENVARVVARDAGALELRGAGAGGRATASAVLGDVVSALRAIGERHDLAHRGRERALDAAIDVSPLFDALPRHPD
ncbi:MAG TPA: homoserine dehydrogenase, partial [Verrucomicrobiae bacterium]|nr:homoserine dehydrogenase [Verrucomicrobiae bacterium]